MRRAAALGAALLLAAWGCVDHRRPSLVTTGGPAAALPHSAEQAYEALSRGFDGEGALEIVTFMSQYWRLSGNPGFDASLEHIKAQLEHAGFTEGSAAPGGGVLSVETYAGPRGWDYRLGTIAFDDAPEPALLSKGRDRVSLAINSFSTVAGGIRAQLVDVGAGRVQSDFPSDSLKGAVVLGDAPLQRLWQEAVKKRGALGVISTELADYIRPDDPAKMSEEQKDVLQWGGIPYDATVKGFGFKAPWRAAARMRERLRNGPVTVRVEVESAFYDAPARTLVAEIPGAVAPSERIVLVAHVQEPGANDNASGCGTLYAIARALAEAVGSGAVARPARTITFMWLDEIRGSRQWMTAHPDAARGVKYMFAMDMTGEDSTKTGGTFLIEKQADPSAVWQRPSDPHTEWSGGGGGVRADSLKGSLLNDLHLAICRRRAQDTGWIVRTNPYEGGSDHTAFAGAGVPSLLDWHFTDRYYHTNQDRPDKTSTAEMTNVGVAVATSAWFLASATPRDAEEVAALIRNAAHERLALERKQGTAIVAAASDRSDAEATEQKVADAWVKWYGEALDTVLTLPAAGADEQLRRRVAELKAAIR